VFECEAAVRSAHNAWGQQQHQQQHSSCARNAACSHFGPGQHGSLQDNPLQWPQSRATGTRLGIAAVVAAGYVSHLQVYDSQLLCNINQWAGSSPMF
jgi:hypothetical protein